MEALITEDKDMVTLDFSGVTSLGPSVFTTLTEICENLRLRGKEPYIHLPNDKDVLSAARRSALTALYDCTIQDKKPEMFLDNARFSIVEA